MNNIGMFSVLIFRLLEDSNIPKSFAHSEVYGSFGLSAGHPIVWNLISTFRRFDKVETFGS